MGCGFSSERTLSESSRYCRTTDYPSKPLDIGYSEGYNDDDYDEEDGYSGSSSGYSRRGYRGYDDSTDDGYNSYRARKARRNFPTEINGSSSSSSSGSGELTFYGFIDDKGNEVLDPPETISPYIPPRRMWADSWSDSSSSSTGSIISPSSRASRRGKSSSGTQYPPDFTYADHLGNVVIEAPESSQVYITPTMCRHGRGSESSSENGSSSGSRYRSKYSDAGTQCDSRYSYKDAGTQYPEYDEPQSSKIPSRSSGRRSKSSSSSSDSWTPYWEYPNLVPEPLNVPSRALGKARIDSNGKSKVPKRVHYTYPERVGRHG